MPYPSVDQLRTQFPAFALHPEHIFMENAGGSQLPAVVIEAMAEYMRSRFVQHGAPYPISQAATEVANEAHDWMLRFMGGEGIGKVVIGPSTSILCQTLAQAHRTQLKERNEIVVAQIGHEANVGPWLRLQEHGAKIVWWPGNLLTLRA